MEIVINKMVDSIYNYFNKYIDLDELESAKLKYSLNTIISEVSKLIILFLIFIILDRKTFYLYSIITLFTIRPFTGGLHFDNYLNCLIFSILFFLLVLFSTIYITITPLLAFVLFVSSSISIATLVPIQSKYRLIANRKKSLKMKLIGLLSIFIHYIVFIINPENLYIINAIWLLSFQSFQLIISKGVILYEKNRSEFHKSNS